MKKMKFVWALAAIMALSTQVQADTSVPVATDTSAYNDSNSASYMSAALPLGALAIAAVIIATTGSSHHHHHGHHHSSSSSSSHAHYSSYSSSSS